MYAFYRVVRLYSFSEKYIIYKDQLLFGCTARHNSLNQMIFFFFFTNLLLPDTTASKILCVKVQSVGTMVATLEEELWPIVP